MGGPCEKLVCARTIGMMGRRNTNNANPYPRYLGEGFLHTQAFMPTMGGPCEKLVCTRTIGMTGKGIPIMLIPIPDT